MTGDQVRALIRERSAKHATRKGSTGVRAWAKANGVSTARVSEFMNGKRNPTSDILAALGLGWEIVRTPPAPTGEEKCRVCDGNGWVCENHLDRPWGGLSDRSDACNCGAGAPCYVCNLDMAIAGRIVTSEHAGFIAGRDAAAKCAEEFNTGAGVRRDIVAIHIADAIRVLTPND